MSGVIRTSMKIGPHFFGGRGAQNVHFWSENLDFAVFGRPLRGKRGKIMGKVKQLATLKSTSGEIRFGGI